VCKGYDYKEYIIIFITNQSKRLQKQAFNQVYHKKRKEEKFKNKSLKISELSGFFKLYLRLDGYTRRNQIRGDKYENQ